MLLQELTGIKHLKDKTPRDIVDFVNDKHYRDGLSNLRFLGSGANGVALTDGKNVFKFWHTDGAYERFVEFCRKHIGNKFLPVFKGPIKKLPLNLSSEYYDDGEPKMKTGVWYVKMELLDQMDRNYTMKIFKDSTYKDIKYDPETIGALLDTVPENKATVIELMDCFYYGNRSGDKEKVVGIMLNRLSYNNGFMKRYQVEDYDKDLVELFETVYDLARSRGVSKDNNEDYFDMHYGNFALRGGQLVILDPFANRSDLDINKEVLRTVRG